MKKNSPARKKVNKLSAEIQQLEEHIAESNKKLSDLKEAKLEAENTEIISIVRDADLSVEDIQELISDLTTVKKPSLESAKSQPTPEMKGAEATI